MKYQFTSEQLTKLLDGAIQLFLEYRDLHGCDEATAQGRAVVDALDGLNGEAKLLADGFTLTPTFTPVGDM
jgi:hypothetical protein